jgi:pseudouridine kinase
MEHDNRTMGIVCVGAAHNDRIARCQAEFVRRASNPVTVTSSHGGVARNVAFNLARLGQRVKLVSVLGADKEGEAIAEELAAAGIDLVDVEHIAARTTASYTAVLDTEGELLCGLADADIYDLLDAARLKALAPRLTTWPLWAIDANLPEAGIGALATAAPDAVRLAALAVSPAKATRLAPHLSRFDMLFANRAEAAALLGERVETAAEALAAGDTLRALGPRLVFITLGEEGVAVATQEACEIYPAPACAVVNVNGAGDAFAAAVMAAHLAGASLAPAVDHGLAAASLTAAAPDTCSAELSALA